jgi:hypothetical protein
VCGQVFNQPPPPVTTPLTTTMSAEVGIPLDRPPLASPPPPPTQVKPTAVWGDSIPPDWQPSHKSPPWSDPLR